MEIVPVAFYHCPLSSKFGVPRQSGVVEELEGTVVLSDDFFRDSVLRGLEDFDYLWLIWGFSHNKNVTWRPTVRPPRLGGNERLGVFATRSPYRPNPLGLSSVRLLSVSGNTIKVSGADLVDGTPIYDIKPYITYTDSHPQAKSGFVDQHSWPSLELFMSEELSKELEVLCGEGSAAIVRELLSQDPRPRYQNDPERVYGMTYGKAEIKFRVIGNTLTIVKIDKNF